jgi:Uma2 family endonuclease
MPQPSTRSAFLQAEHMDHTGNNIAMPDRMHQEICFALARKIADFIDSCHGSCKVYPAPFAVFLNDDCENYVQPDISVICDQSKLKDRGCNGAPDWIIEIVSPATQRIDYFVKLFKYRISGVREYWIVNPMKHTVQVYSFDGDGDSMQFSFEDTVKVGIYDSLHIRIADFLKT